MSALSLLGLSAGSYYLAEYLHHAPLMIADLSLHFDPLLACLIAEFV